MALLSGCKGDRGDTGPAGASGTIFEKDFQYGLLPDIYYSTSSDTKIINGVSYQSDSYGGCDEMSVGTVAGSKARALIRFDLTDLAPNGVKVNSAVLTLRTIDVANPVTVTAYAMGTTWYEGGAGCAGSVSGDTSWDSLSPAGGAFNLSAPVSNSVAKKDGTADTFNPVYLELKASLVQGWINNPTANYGVILVASDETAPNSFISFATNENSINNSYCPKLIIYYELP